MKQKLFRIVADLRFALINLLIISLCSVIGTIIEQDQPVEIYKKNYPLTNPIFHYLTWEKILTFGLDHVYKTWWFLFLVILFGVSLITCTYLQQFPSLNIARRCQFFRNIKQFKSLSISTVLKNYTYPFVIRRVKTKNYSIFQQKNIFYCYKGLIGKLAPIVVHFSMILILIGTLISAIYGFKAQETIPKTEIGYIQNIFSNGQLTRIPTFSIRVNDFWITYNQQNNVSQFYSDLSILNNYGLELERQTSFVNSPLIFNKTYYYQTDWNLIGLRFENFQNQKIEYPLIKPAMQTNNKIWLTWISSNETSGIIAILDNIQGYCSIYTEEGKFLGNLELHEKINKIFSMKLLEILSSTGLQIKNDPGIYIVYGASFLFMVSILISYMTYSQLWILSKNNKIFFGGNTSRASFDFELEFFEFINQKID